MKTKRMFRGTWVDPVDPVDYWVQGFLAGVVLIGFFAWFYIWAVSL